MSTQSPAINNPKKYTGICITVIAFLILGTLVIKLIWIFRMGSLIHWSYLVGRYAYPEDLKKSVILSCSLVSFILIGSCLPRFFCPKLRNMVAILSIPPQLHMLMILNAIHRNIKNVTNNEMLTKSVRIYTGLTLISAVWTVVSFCKG